jgi:hypothetical protein
MPCSVETTLQENESYEHMVIVDKARDLRVVWLLATLA